MGTADAALLEIAGAAGRTLLGRGDPRAVRTLLCTAEHLREVAWATLPRLGAGPKGVRGAPEHEGPHLDPDADLPARVRDRLGVQPATAWDWFATDRAPVTDPDDVQVTELDPGRDAEAIRDCLTEANPDTQADPADPGEAAWFGVADGDRWVGVIGAATRAGDPAGADLSWHLHGLGVRPAHRGRALGRALTAAATRAALERSADWVSLGMYASNAPARRVYTDLGFELEGRFTSYRRAGGAGHRH